MKRRDADFSAQSQPLTSYLFITLFLAILGLLGLWLAIL
jgi:hypothetical protein